MNSGPKMLVIVVVVVVLACQSKGDLAESSVRKCRKRFSVQILFCLSLSYATCRQFGGHPLAKAGRWKAGRQRELERRRFEEDDSRNKPSERCSEQKQLRFFCSFVYVCLYMCVCVFVCWFTMYSLHEIDLEFVSECERLRVSDQPRLSSTTFMCVSAVWIVSIYFFSQSEAPEGRKEYF